MQIPRPALSPAARRPAGERGSLLIVAMIFCAIIGIALTSYIMLSRTALNISNRGLYANASMNLAEDGLEQAMYSINKGTSDDTYSWSADGWTVSGLNARRKWTGLNLSQNTTGEYRVYVYNYAGVSNPTIVTRALVTLGGAAGAPIEKWIRVTLSKTSKFSNGLVAKNSIVFNGNNTSVDSWNSDPDNSSATAAIPYSAGVRNDNGSVGSISVSTSAVLVKQADVWGYVATGSSDPTSSVGANGSILGSDSVPDGSWTKSTVDPSRVSTNFSANFDPVTAPATYSYTSAGTLNSSKTLPDDFPAATLQADGKYYISCTSIGGSNNVFTIAAGKKVVLKVTDTTGNSVDIKGGSGALNINSGGSLEIYTAGDINIGGQGVMNSGTTAATAGQPVNLQIYGTKTSGTQAISIAGNGALSGCIYAPQGSVTINGNGDVMGSIVANDITLVGNALFHYDESLSNLGGANPFRVAGWTELTSAAERATYSGVLTF